MHAPDGRLDVLLNIAPSRGSGFRDYEYSIDVLAAHGCAPYLVINAIFDVNDDFGSRAERFASEEAAHFDLRQALLDRNIRANAVRISSFQFRSDARLDAS
jgi:hypothetical protein